MDAQDRRDGPSRPKYPSLAASPALDRLTQAQPNGVTGGCRENS